MSVRVCGVPGLLEISWRTRSDPAAVIEKKKASDGKYLPAPHLGWEVITRGSSLREVISMPQVDVPSLVTNNPFQVLDVLGIEAARKLYLVELRACMNNADEAMLQTAVDSMLHKGLITPANRFGANPMDGPLTRASNEMSTQTLLRAATSHQRESLAGVSASTMLGQPMRIGTGLPKLLWDEESWLEMREEPILNAKVVIDPVTYQPTQSGISSLISKLSLVTGRTYQASDVEEV
jgi:DNA-directed RNA polymerase beta' subunit